MKDNSIIEVFARQLFDPGAMLRGNIRQKLDGNRAIFQLDQDGVLGVVVLGHEGSFC